MVIAALSHAFSQRYFAHSLVVVEFHLVGSSFFYARIRKGLQRPSYLDMKKKVFTAEF